LTISVYHRRWFRRHFTSADSIMDENPAVAQLSVVKRECQRSKIESAFRRRAVMTVKAGVPDQFTN
jgi:hypothetical protein